MTEIKWFGEVYVDKLPPGLADTCLRLSLSEAPGWHPVDEIMDLGVFLIQLATDTNKQRDRVVPQEEED